jgi:hypothetical protein
VFVHALLFVADAGQMFLVWHGDTSITERRARRIPNARP